MSLWPPCGLLGAFMGVLLGSTAAPSVPLQYLLKNIYLLDVTRYPSLSGRPNLHGKNRFFGLGPLILLENTAYAA